MVIKKIIKYTWAYSPLLTLPITLFYFLWVLNTINLYNTLKYQILGASLLHHGKTSFLQLKYQIFNSFIKSSSLSEPNFQLYIKNDKIRQLNSNLPLSGFKYQEGLMKYSNNTLQKVLIRYRGDHHYHWLYKRKSMRIKTPKTNLYEGNLLFNLIILKGNELLNNHIVYKLSKELGILAPETRMVTLFVNNKYEGIRLYCEQLGKRFLKKYKRMRGDLYSGDNVGIAKLLGIDNKDIFSDAYFWEKVTFNKHYDRNDKSNLMKLLEELDQNNLTMLSIQDFAKFSVMITLSQTKHFDHIHNWRLYYDNYLERFYPIVWDPIGWWKEWIPPESGMPEIEIISAPILEKLFKDYQFLYQRHIVLQDFFKYKENEFLNILDNEIDSLSQKIKYLDYSINIAQGMMNREETLQEIYEFGEKIKKLFHDIKLLTLCYNNCLELNDSIQYDSDRLKQFNDPIEFKGKNSKIWINTTNIPEATFTYEFWFNTYETHEIDIENAYSGTTGLSGQHFALFPHYGGKGNHRGSGVSIGVNGVSVYEHKNKYLGARIVYEGLLNGWNHIAVVYQNNAPTLYVNGVKIASKKATKDTIRPIFHLGGHYQDNKYFNGLLDEFRVWSRALTVEEIKTNMNRELTGKEKGLTVYYNFNEIKNDTIIPDISKHSREGIIVNESANEVLQKFQYTITNNKIRILVNGRIPINKMIFEFNQRLTSKRVFIEYFLNGQKVRKDISGTAAISDNEIIINQPLLARMEVISKEMKIFPATYDIIFENLNINTINDIKFQIMDIEGSVIEPEELDYIKIEKFKDVYNVVEENPIKQPLIWKNKVYIKGIQVIKNDLIIKPGTKVILDKKATVKVIGKVTAIGTKEKPIQFISKRDDKPYGAFVLKDEKANGSRMEFCRFINGSGLKGDLFEYMGMLSIHNVNNVIINNCTFNNNRLTNKIVYSVYSQVTFNDCSFQKNYDDAMGADFSKIIIKNCKFTDKVFCFDCFE